MMKAFGHPVEWCWFNISIQHRSTLLKLRCWTRLATLLNDVDSTFPFNTVQHCWIQNVKRAFGHPNDIDPSYNANYSVEFQWPPLFNIIQQCCFNTVEWCWMTLIQVTMLITMLNSNGHLFQHRTATLFQQCWMMLNDIDSSYNV